MEFKYLDLSAITKLGEIDRTEIIHEVYYVIDGKLVLKDEYYNIKPWNDVQIRSKVEITTEILNRGGVVIGAFDGSQLVGLASLDTQKVDSNLKLLNLAGLWVSNPHRKLGVASKLVDFVIKEAKQRGYEGLYISATPSKNTVEFYMNRGAILADHLDPRLFEMEPEDIHLILKFHS